MRRVLLLLSVALGCAAVACGGRAPVLTAQRVADGFALEARAPVGYAIAVFASRLWSPEVPRELAWVGSVLDASALPDERVAPFVLGASRAASAPAVACTISDDVVPKGTFAVQAAALAVENGRVITRWSNAFVIERASGRVVLRSYRSMMGATYGPWWILGLVVIGALVLGTRVLKIPTDRRPRLWLGALVVATLALLAPRIWRIPEQCWVESGLDVPPLVWPSDWELGGDGIDHILGPGYLALESAARELQGPDDSITIVVKEGGIFEEIRGIYLANRLPRTSLIFDPRPCPRGLAIFLGRPADGRELAKFDVGTLAAVGAERP